MPVLTAAGGTSSWFSGIFGGGGAAEAPRRATPVPEAQRSGAVSGRAVQAWRDGSRRRGGDLRRQLTLLPLRDPGDGCKWAEERNLQSVQFFVKLHDVANGLLQVMMNRSEVMQRHRIFTFIKQVGVRRLAKLSARRRQRR